MPNPPQIIIDTGSSTPSQTVSSVVTEDVSLIEQEASTSVAGFARGPRGLPGTPGTPGAPGQPGPAGAATEYPFPTPAATWTVTHSLGRTPLVQVVVNGEVVNADVEYPDVNTVVVVHADPASGSVLIL